MLDQENKSYSTQAPVGSAVSAQDASPITIKSIDAINNSLNFMVPFFIGLKIKSPLNK